MKTQAKATNATNAPQYLNVEETANVLRASVFFVRSEIKAGKLKASKVGRIYLIDVRDIEAYFEGLAVKTDAGNDD